MTKQLKERLLTDLGLGRGKRGILGRVIYRISIEDAGPGKSIKQQNREIKHRLITNRLMGI